MQRPAYRYLYRYIYTRIFGAIIKLIIDSLNFLLTMLIQYTHTLISIYLAPQFDGKMIVLVNGQKYPLIEVHVTSR